MKWIRIYTVIFAFSRFVEITEVTGFLEYGRFPGEFTTQMTQRLDNLQIWSFLKSLTFV